MVWDDNFCDITSTVGIEPRTFRMLAKALPTMLRTWSGRFEYAIFQN